MNLHLNSRNLLRNRLPYHIHGVTFPGRVPELKEPFDFLEPTPHPCPLILTDSPDEVDEEILLDSVGGFDKDAELGVVEDVLEGEFDGIADDDGDAMAGYGVKEAV